MVLCKVVFYEYTLMMYSALWWMMVVGRNGTKATRQPKGEESVKDDKDKMDNNNDICHAVA